MPPLKSSGGYFIEERPKLNIAVSVKLDSKNQPTIINSKIKIQRWNKQPKLCFHLPYRDLHYGQDRENMSKFQSKNRAITKLSFRYGNSEIVIAKNQKPVFLAPHIFSIPNSQAKGWIEIKTKSNLPQLANASKNDYFYRGFYPQPLASCPEKSDLKHALFSLKPLQTKLEKLPSLSISGEITSPQPWKIASSGLHDPSGKSSPLNTVSFNDEIKREFSFGLSKHYKTKEFFAKDHLIKIFYHSNSVQNLFSTIRSSFLSNRELLGILPNKESVLIETAEVHSLGIPGVIPFNRPQQKAFQTIQEQFLNWQQWIISSQIASQWFMGSTFSQNKNDKWFFEGFINFLTQRSLKKEGDHLNIFNPDRIPTNFLSLNFTQAQQITAFFLKQDYPFEVLTDSSYLSVRPFSQQPPILFIRHTMALNQLEAFLGPKKMSKLLSSYFLKVANTSSTPANFIQYLKKAKEIEGITTKEKQQAIKNLSSWWSTTHWPDFFISDVQSEQLPSKQWKTLVTVKQGSKLNIPVKITLTTEHGEKISKIILFEEEKQTEEITFLHPTPQKVIEIDPENKIFDSNRFNNSNKPPSVVFFPGNANTIENDRHTVFWGPYGFRRAGQPVFLGVTGAIFRYLNSGLFFSAERSISSSQGSFSVRHKNNFSKYALNLNTSITQDYLNQRIILGELIRSPLFKSGPPITVSGKIRQRKNVGSPEEDHATTAAEFKILQAAKISNSKFQVSGEYEVAPESFSKRISYTRKKILGIMSYNSGRNYSFYLRFFRGKLTNHGTLPLAETYFKINDATEASVRIDRGNINPSKNIFSYTTEVGVPFPLLIPARAMVLARKIKLNVFYDQGLDLSTSEVEKFEAAGVTVEIPLGGSLMGAGEIGLANISFTSILYQNYNQTISKEPNFLFNVSAAL